jgi:hypothetical protein
MEPTPESNEKMNILITDYLYDLPLHWFYKYSL